MGMEIAKPANGAENSATKAPESSPSSTLGAAEISQRTPASPLPAADRPCLTDAIAKGPSYIPEWARRKDISQPANTTPEPDLHTGGIEQRHLNSNADSTRVDSRVSQTLISTPEPDLHTGSVTRALGKSARPLDTNTLDVTKIDLHTGGTPLARNDRISPLNQPDTTATKIDLHTGGIGIERRSDLFNSTSSNASPI